MKRKVKFRILDLNILKLLDEGMRRHNHLHGPSLVLSANHSLFVRNSPQKLFADIDSFSHIVLLGESIDLDNDNEKSPGFKIV